MNNNISDGRKEIRLASTESYSRRRLADLLPLATPLGITVLTTNICNLKCEFCIQTSKHMQRNVYRKDMPLSLFKKIVDDIGYFDQKIKAFHFCPNGEPLMTKDIYEMIDYVKKANVAEKVDIITNGIPLTKSNSEKLLKTGIDWVRISLYGLSDEDFLNYTDTKVNFQKYVDNLTFLYQMRGNTRIYIKIMDYMIKDDSRRQFYYDTFSSISDHIGVENCMDHHDSIKTDFNTHISMFCDQDSAKSVCAIPFGNMYVMPNGDVMPCGFLKYVITNDMKPIANLNDMSLREIWDGNNLKSFKYKMLSGQSACGFPCSECNGPTTATHPEDNLDNDAERLKSFFI